MKIALIKKHNKVRLDEVDMPMPGPGEVLLQIDACGVCGSDYLEATAWAQDWKRFGHEVAATVFSTGPGVEGFTVGDQVVMALSIGCGECNGCLAGNPRRCSSLIVAEQGGFGEYLLVKNTRLLLKVEPRLPVGLAVFTEPVTVVLDAFHLVGLKPGDKLVVIGGGFIACISLLIAKALGVENPLVLSRKVHPGLDNCLTATKGEHICWQTLGGITRGVPDTFVQKLCGHGGRVVVLHTAPAKFIPLYIEQLPYDSLIVNVGLSGRAKDNELKVDAARLIFKRIQVMSAFPVPCLYLSEAIGLLQKNQDLFSLLTTESVPLEQLPKVLAALRKPKRKILIVFPEPGDLPDMSTRQETATIIDLIFSLYPYGMKVSGVSFLERLIPGTHPCGDGSFRERNEETFFRWFAGPETILKFASSGKRKMILYVGFINTFLGQDVLVEVNGRQLEHLKGIKENVVVRKHYVFQGQIDNEIILRYRMTNASTNKYPYDSRDVSEMFFEFKVVDADVDVKDLSYSQRFDYSSITHLGFPVQNAALNRKEYEEGQTVLKSLPSVVTLALTTHCNNKIPCMICDRNTRPSIGDCEIDQKMIEITVPLLKTAMYVLLHCGGEAMFSRYYDQVIESIQPPTRVTFATNAMLMTHKRADLMLKKDIMAGIVISLDAATPQIYRIMRPGSKFETVIDNVAYYIARTKELGCGHSNVTLNMTLCEANICDAPKLVDLAVKIGAWGVDFNHLNSGLRHTAMTVDGWEWNYIEQADFKDKNQHDRLILETYRKAQEKGVHISLVGKPFIGPDASKFQEIVGKMTSQVAFQESQGVDHWSSSHHKRLGAHIPPCFKPWQEIVIQPDGTVRLCYFHDLQIWSLGHFGRSDFMSIWNSDQMVEARKQFLSHAVARACSESQPCMHRGRE